MFPIGRPPHAYVRALDGVDLRINPGELFVILGPSGSGKSTLLRAIAGLEEPEEGTIALGRNTVYSAMSGESVPAQNRHVGMVFQNFALYPHLTVEENVGFGLRSRKVPRNEIQPRVDEALRLVNMMEFASRTPAALSGGQQQRVALARAVAGKPRLLLFDEPLSNLDPLLRKSVRTELKQLMSRLSVTSLFVTHDQEEAMIMGDRLAVMNNGRIEQVGTPDEIYLRPASTFVASFTGRPVTNLIEGVVDEYEGRTVVVPIGINLRTMNVPETFNQYRGQRILINVRPEDVEVDGPEPSRNAVPAAELEIRAVLPEGGYTFVHMDLGRDAKPLVVRCGLSDVIKGEIGEARAVHFRRGTIYGGDSKLLLGSFG